MSQLFKTACLAAIAVDFAQAKMTDAPYFYRTDRPMVISHRGSFGHFPEHSLGGYIDAYYGGTDYIELDLQLTKDGYLVAQHDSYLDLTTNIYAYKDQFGNRRHLDGRYYVNDFTLAELKMLTRKQRYQDRSQFLNDTYKILTLQEVIDHVQMLDSDYPRSVNTDTKVGLYIEIKDYAQQLKDLGIDPAEKLNEVLSNNDLGSVDSSKDSIPVIIQSFELEALQKYATLSDLPLVMLCHYNTDYDFEQISKVAHGVGPAKDYIMNPDSLTNKQEHWDMANLVGGYSPFVTQMHELGLAVHPYVLQDDRLKYTETAYDETALWVNTGIDGAFTEFPDTTYDIFQKFGWMSNWPTQESLNIMN